MALTSAVARRLTGRSETVPDPVTLRAGPVRALLEGADLRHVRVGDAELLQRVYVAVRDAPWNTIPAGYDDWSIEQRKDTFSVRFRATHRHEAIAFTWRGTISGAADGTIRYEMDGTCRGVFQYSKIGFNVHHAADRSVGRRFRAQTERGELRGVLPEAIDPQRIVGTTLTGMFEPYSEIAIEVEDGLEAVVGLEGDLLELQDHRNWTDGNFKSYGTPLARGFPFDSVDGGRIRQVLTIEFRGSVPAARPRSPPTITIEDVIAARLPQIGFGQPSHGRPLSPAEASRIALLGPIHLRVDVPLSDAGFESLERAAADARAVGAALELAVFADDEAGDALDRLAARIERLGVRVARVLVYVTREGFSAVQGVTPPSVGQLVRERLEPATGPVAFAGGTNQNFSDINRDRPSDVFSGICYSMSPTVHAADDASIVENIAAQGDVVRFTRSFAGARPISISPITIATRFGPYPAGPSGPDDLPAAVDVRQASLLGAAWTLGSIAALAEAGADSVTWYETTGWRGVVERDAGSPDPRFPSRPGDTFPMAHVFADVAERPTARVRRARSDQPLRAVGLALEDDAGSRLLVANVSPDETTVVVRGLPEGDGRLRVLDTSTVERATRDPTSFRAEGAPVRVTAGAMELTLGPYGTARVDLPGH